MSSIHFPSVRDSLILRLLQVPMSWGIAQLALTSKFLTFLYIRFFHPTTHPIKSRVGRRDAYSEGLRDFPPSTQIPNCRPVPSSPVAHSLTSPCKDILSSETLTPDIANIRRDPTSSTLHPHNLFNLERLNISLFTSYPASESSRWTTSLSRY